MREAPGPLVRGLPACSVPLLAAAAAAAAAGRAGGVRLLPKLLRHGSPILGIGDGLVGQMLHRLGRLGVGGMGAGLVDDLADLLRVLQHGAGAQHVVVEGLAVMIGHKQRGLQALQQGLLPNVGVGIVDEDTGVHIAVGVDMQIAPAAGDASAHVFRVVLEVHGKDALPGAHLPDPAVDLGPLLGLGHQLGSGVVAHGHVVEEPDKVRAQINDLVVELLAGDVLIVDAGIAGGDAEGQAMALQQGHRVRDLLIHALAAAAVVGLFEALQADGGDEVLHPQHILAELLVDEGGVGEGQERGVAVLLAQGDDVLLAHQGLAAGVNVQIDAKLLALGDDGVDLVKGQIELIAVLRRPAAGAVQVAGRGGVQQDGPGDVAVVFLAQLLLLGPAHQVGVDKEVGEDRLQHVGIGLGPDLLDELIPTGLGIADDLVEHRALGRQGVSGKLIDQIHHLVHVVHGILVQIIEYLGQTVTLDTIRNLHNVFFPFHGITIPSVRRYYNADFRKGK